MIDVSIYSVVETLREEHLLIQDFLSELVSDGLETSHRLDTLTLLRKNLLSHVGKEMEIVFVAVPESDQKQVLDEINALYFKIMKILDYLLEQGIDNPDEIQYVHDLLMERFTFENNILFQIMIGQQVLFEQHKEVATAYGCRKK